VLFVVSNLAELAELSSYGTRTIPGLSILPAALSMPVSFAIKMMVERCSLWVPHLRTVVASLLPSLTELRAALVYASASLVRIARQNSGEWWAHISMMLRIPIIFIGNMKEKVARLPVKAARSWSIWFHIALALLTRYMEGALLRNGTVYQISAYELLDVLFATEVAHWIAPYAFFEAYRLTCACDGSDVTNICIIAAYTIYGAYGIPWWAQFLYRMVGHACWPGTQA
jgi:hypothetical protein